MRDREDLLEKDIDGRIVKFAKKLGCIVIKLTSIGSRGEAGWPDRLFLRFGYLKCHHCGATIKYGKAVFMEMKKPGGRPSPLQEHQMKRLAEQEFPTYWTDDETAAKAAIAQEFL